MELRVIRSWIKGNAACGTLMIKGDHGWERHCATLEDLPRPEKIKHETCIPVGTYEVKKREILSGMTKRYRTIYGDKFDFHLELQGVEDYDYVYIHHGNRAGHTSGCILLGSAITTSKGNGFVTNSRKTFINFYQMVEQALNAGETVTIEVVEEYTANA